MRKFMHSLSKLRMWNVAWMRFKNSCDHVSSERDSSTSALPVCQCLFCPFISDSKPLIKDIVEQKLKRLSCFHTFCPLTPYTVYDSVLRFIYPKAVCGGIQSATPGGECFAFCLSVCRLARRIPRVLHFPSFVKCCARHCRIWIFPARSFRTRERLFVC